jgi:DNA-binding NarL/FixJ family response regulator
MNKTRILIIEDERALANSIAEFLAIKEFDTDVFYDGEKALAHLDDCSPNLIICDIAMPGMNGLDILGNIRANNKYAHIPFIFLTAKTSSNDLRDGMKRGADDYLFKPFKFSDLYDAIHSRFGRINQLNTSIPIDDNLSKQLTLLTKKERHILTLIANGTSSKKIADSLFISVKTVENHRYSITNKLDLSGQGSLLKFAMSHKDQLQ